MSLKEEFALLGIAKDAAYKAGKFLMVNQDTVADSSVGKDIKLAADKKSEQVIMEILKPTGIPILSEEAGLCESKKGNELMWIVDPLDGSANYAKGMRELTCVSVALWENEAPVLGVINRYAQNELFSGLIGEGAWLNENPILPSNVSYMGNAILATGFPVGRGYDASSLATFIEQVQKFKKIRMLGAAALMGVSVACGRIDAYMEEDIMIWDIAAATAIVKAAGGYANVICKEENKCNCQLFANERLFANWNEGNRNA